MSGVGVVLALGLLWRYVRWAYPGPQTLALPTGPDGTVRLHCQELREHGDPRLSARWGAPRNGRLELALDRLTFTPDDDPAGGWQAAVEDVTVIRVHDDDDRWVAPSVDARILGVGSRRLRVSDRPIRRFTIDHTTTRHEALAAQKLAELLSPPAHP